MENTQTKVMTIWQGLADPHKWYTENGQEFDPRAAAAGTYVIEIKQKRPMTPAFIAVENRRNAENGR
jgi:hypothetical protein